MFKIAVFLLMLSSWAVSQELPGLGRSIRLNLGQSLKGKTVWFFFKPNCPFCVKQVRGLDCLSKKQRKRIFPVGFAATEEELWKEGKKLKLASYGLKSSYYADQKITERFKLKGQASPQILLMDGKKTILHHLGALKCSVISEFLK